MGEAKVEGGGRLIIGARGVRAVGGVELREGGAASEWREGMGEGGSGG